jgi:hypothetical protein
VVALRQYVELSYAADLLDSGDGRRVGYLLKDRVADVEEFAATLRQVAEGGTVVDPQIVRQLMRRRTDPLARLTPRERQVPGEHQARPECSGRAWKAVASFARNDRSVRAQKIVTVAGGEAIPLATTTSVLLPAGVPGGTVNSVEDLVPGATDTEVQSLVRA